MKQIRVMFSDGSAWVIPAEFIADDRAQALAKQDAGGTDGEEFDQIYTEEFQYTLGSEFELTDWAANNMDWIDVVGMATRVDIPTADYTAEWVNVKKQVISTDEKATE